MYRACGLAVLLTHRHLVGNHQHLNLGGRQVLRICHHQVQHHQLIHRRHPQLRLLLRVFQQRSLKDRLLLLLPVTRHWSLLLSRKALAPN